MGSDPLTDATQFEQPKRWIPGMRSSAYAAIFALIFALAAGQIGLVSYLFQANGNGRDPSSFLWPSPILLRNTGLVLATALVTLLLCLGAFWCPQIPLLFLLFAIMAMWLSAGAIYASASPFKAGCHGPYSGHAAAVAGQCEEYVALHALSWALFGLTLFTFIALVYDFYGRKVNKKRTAFGA